MSGRDLGIKIHPAAEAFPLLTGEEFEEFCADISEHGQRDPIVLMGPVLLDGRNRWRACQRLGIEPRTVQWRENGSPAAYVVSANLKRRHLTPSQRAMIAAELKPAFAKEAKERQRNHGGTAPGRKKKLDNTRVKGDTSVEAPHSDDGKARTAAAKAANVSAGYVSTAERVKAERPDLAAKVKSGEITLREASRQVRQQELTKKTASLPTGKYRVIYADPPWKYRNDGAEMEGYGVAAGHYPTMSIEELCALDIKAIAAEDAVLFLWVTSPLLDTAFPVIRAWGFSYKTSFVWDKVKHNFGHYNSVRHEFLLIATRGSCTPESKQLHDSVQSIERSQKHSEKPEEFRKLIEEMYPSGKRVELFARKKVAGWERFSNEL